jgi:glycosyltransferase involved in cell wall biosynthesis
VRLAEGGTNGTAGVPAPARVLFLIDELDIGGTEQQILELVSRLDRRRYAPLVCCFRPGRVSREIEAAGVPVFVFRKRAKLDVRLIWNLVRLMRRERVDLLQTYLFTANTWGRLAGRLAGVPIIVTAERNVDMWEQGIKRVLGVVLDRWTRITTANSEAVKAYLTRKGLRGDKVRVIYNGVDASRFDGSVDADATRAELGIPAHHAVVGLLARLEPQKDPRTFLQAAAMVAETCPAVSFLVVGGGSLYEDLRREAEDLDIARRVVFTGPRRDVARLLAVCDVTVICSLKEGMSNSIMESMAAGKPVVASRVGGNPELIEDGESGFLVRPRDAVGLASAVRRLVEDPALARAFGQRARARISKQCSVDAMVDATRRLYDELIRSSALPVRPLARATPMAAAGDEAVHPVPGPGRSPRTIALVASQFPRYVDAYFLREVSALAARGLRFRIFSLRGFRGDVVHAAARPLLADTVYVPFLWSWPLLRAHGRFLRTSPGRYVGALAAVVAGCLTRPRALLRSLAVFPKSVYFAELVREEGIEHIHANWASHPATSALVMSRLTGVPWSFAGHASDIYLDGSMLVEKIHAAKFVVTCTRHNKDFLVERAGAETADKIVVSYHGVDLNRFRPAPGERGEGFRILTAGTLRECKGLPDLIEACRILAARGISLQCAIVGDGADRRSLERLIQRAGLADRVRITGFLSQEALIPLYQDASVVVLPALPESHFGIPNILLEALAVETPVVCTPLPSLSEIMEDGQYGLFTPERSPAALAAALETLARDPERRRAMGRAGRQMVEALFDTAKNVGTLEALFRPSDSATPAGVPPESPATSRRAGTTARSR